MMRGGERMGGAYEGQGAALVLRWMRSRAQLSRHCRRGNRQGGEGECERDWASESMLNQSLVRGYSLSSLAMVAGREDAPEGSTWRASRIIVESM